MSVIDFDAIRLAIAARMALLAVSTDQPTVEPVWTESPYSYEYLGLEPATYGHRKYATRVRESIPASGARQTPGKPFLMVSTVDLRALWRLGPHQQDTTRDTGHQVLLDVHRWLSAARSIVGHMTLKRVATVLKADREWVQLDWTYTVPHLWGA